MRNWLIVAIDQFLLLANLMFLKGLYETWDDEIGRFFMLLACGAILMYTIWWFV